MTFGGSNSKDNIPTAGISSNGGGTGAVSSGGGMMVGVMPSFGNGMGQGQLGQLFANIIAQRQQQPLAPQTMPAVPVTDKGRPSLISQQSNPTNQFGAVPIILGEMLMTPYVGAGLWMSFREGDNNNDCFVGYIFGYGPIAVNANQIKVGDAVIADLADPSAPGRPPISYELVLTANDTPQTLIQYDTHTTYIGRAPLYNEKQYCVVPQDADKVLIALEFPNGLYQNDTVTDYETIEDPENPGEFIDVPSGSHTERASSTVEIALDYRIANDPEASWSSITSTWSIAKELGDPFFIAYEWEPPELGHYEIRLKRKTTVGDGTAVVNTFNWFSVSGILTANPPYPADPPLDANGNPCHFAQMSLKAHSTAQFQSAIDPVTAVVASIIPTFRNNLGLEEIIYAIDDKPIEPKKILDSSGNHNHGQLVFAATDIDTDTAYWSGSSPKRLNFNQQTYITIDLDETGYYYLGAHADIKLSTLTSAKIEGTFKASGGTGTENGICRFGALGQVWQDPSTDELVCTVGDGADTTEYRIAGAVDDTVFKFSLELSSDTTNITILLSLFDNADVLIDTDGGTVAIATLDPSPDSVLLHSEIGRSSGAGGFAGQIYDVALHVDSALVGEWAIDDNNVIPQPDYRLVDTVNRAHGVINNTIGAFPHAYDPGSGTGGWIAGTPPKLKFKYDTEATLPLGIDEVTATSMKFDCRVMFDENTSGPTNVILGDTNGTTGNFAIWQDQDNNDLVCTIFDGLELRVEDEAVNSTEFRVVLELEKTTHWEATLSLYDEDDVLLGSDTLIDTDDDFSLRDDLSLGSESISAIVGDGFYGVIWNLAIELDSAPYRSYAIDDKPYEEPVLGDPDEITDTGSDALHGILHHESFNYWTETPPYRLNFNGADIYIESPFYFDTYEAGLGDGTRSISFSASFIAEGSGINPIFSTGGMLIYQDGATGDLVFYFDDDDIFELRSEDSAPSGEERRVVVILIPSALEIDHAVNVNIQVFDESNTLLDTVNSNIPSSAIHDHLHDVVCYIGVNDDDSEWFTGQIWDVGLSAQNSQFTTNGGTSSNPAMECLYLMRSPSFNPKPIPDNLIDFPGFYEWSKQCAQLGYEFHAIIDQPTVLWNLVQDVAKAGRGRVVKRNGLYSPAMDLSKLRTGQLPAQHFTRFNSSGFRYRNTKQEKYHAVRINYLDPNDKYQQTSVVVYNEGYDATNATRYAPPENYYGCKSKSLAQRYGRHVLADLELRSKEYELTTDWEGLVCAIGDHVYVSHDAALIGTAAGRIISKNIDAGIVESITIDNGCTFEVGKTYAVRLRDSHFNTVLADVTNPGAGIYYELTFANPVTEETLEHINPGDIFQFGEQNIESKLMIIDKIDRLADHASRFILKEYAEGVYTFEAAYANGIPDYTSTARVAPQYRFEPPVPVISSITPTGLTASVVLATISVDDVKYLMVSYREEGSDDAYVTKTASPSAGSPTTITITGLTAATTYEVRARSISHASVVSEWCDLETVEIS